MSRMQHSLTQYLREKGKFYSPPIGTSDTTSTDVNDIEASRLDKRWKPTVAFRDSQLVDTLIGKLNEILGNASTEHHLFDDQFQPVLDRNGSHAAWESNRSEYQARKTHAISNTPDLLIYNQGSAPS